jgi:hypothetical protein
MEVYLNYLLSLNDRSTPIRLGSKEYTYNPIADIRLSTLTYITIARYNIPTDKLPESLRANTTIKAVAISKRKTIKYFEHIEIGCMLIHHMHAYIPHIYNVRQLEHISIGSIPPSVIYIATSVPVRLTPAIKYLLLYNISEKYNINVELEYLYINGIIHAPVTTTRPIKFLHIETVRNSLNILTLFNHARYVIFVQNESNDYYPDDPHLLLRYIIDSTVERILIPTDKYNTFITKKIIVNYGGTVIPSSAYINNKC